MAELVGKGSKAAGEGETKKQGASSNQEMAICDGTRPKSDHNRKSQTRRVMPTAANSGCQEGRVLSDVTIQATGLKRGASA